MSYSEIAIKHV